MTSPIEGRVTLDTSEADRNLGGLKDSTVTAAAVMTASVAAANKAFELLGSAITFAADSTKEFVRLAGVQQAAEQRLISVSKAFGDTTDDLVESFTEFTGAFQQLTGIGDEVTLGLLAAARAQGVYKEDLELTVLAAKGFSDAHGIGMREAIKIVAKGVRGNKQAFAEYGGAVEDAGAEVRRYAAVASDTANATDLLNTKLAVAGANFDDFQESLGLAIANSPAVQKLVTDMAEGFLSLAETVAKHEDDIVDFIDTAVSGLVSIASKIDIIASSASNAIPGLAALGAAAAAVGGGVRVAIGGEEEDGGEDAEVKELKRKARLAEVAQREINTANQEAAKVANAALAAIEKEWNREREREQKRFLDERRRADEQAAKDAEDAARALAEARAEREAAQAQFLIDVRAMRRSAELQVEIDDNERRFQEEVSAFDERRDAREDRDRKEKAAEKRLASQLSSITRSRLGDRIQLFKDAGKEEIAVVGALGAEAVELASQGLEQTFVGIGEAIAGGFDQLNLGRIWGKLIEGFGVSLIQLGTRAAVGGVLGLVAPILAPETGGPAAIVAGGAAIAAGIAMVGVGKAISGGADPGAAGGRGGARSSGGGGRSSGGLGGVLRDRLPSSARETPLGEGFSGGLRERQTGASGVTRGGDGNIVNNFFVSFRGVSSSSSDRLSRDLRMVNKRAGRLRGVRALQGA